ncbi:response regulator transcription factor [Paenibacillus sp. TRM 82003]|nr:response regulator transcription factor [Paenibacillus sp. TRM 82003]
MLLVDDEPMIREGLRTLIDWESYGYTVVDTAANGKEALTKYESVRPDLMIVDIRMPGMNGLELIEALRAKDQGLHMLILSGYADFDYAKKAIVNRIDGYLLKPVDEDELIDYLKKLRGVMEEEKRRRSASGAAVADMSKERIVQALLAGEAPSSGGATEGFGWPEYEVLLVKPLGRGELEGGIVRAVKRELADRFEGTGRGVVFEMEPYVGILSKASMADPYHRDIAYRQISDACQKADTDFAVSAGGAAADWSDVPASYESALRLMKHRFFHPSGKIVREGETAFPQGDAHEPNMDELTEKLFFAVDIGNLEAIASIVGEAGERLAAAGLAEQAIKACVVQIGASVIGKLALHRPDVQTQSQSFSVEMLEVYKEYRFEDLLAHATKLFQSLAESLDDQGTETVVKRMIDVIQRNYHENLKLETLAELLHYNSAYLGKVFKASTGEYFNTYVDQVRIAHAKELLEQGMKVYQVAEKVGYANVDYFHSKFRKYVGTSPSAYKKK